MKKESEKVSLRVHLNHVFTSLILSFSEESAKAFGLGHEDTMKLILACEELFTYLCRIDKNNKPITIEISNDIYFVQIKVIFDVAAFDPRAFNIAANISLDDTNAFGEMNLLLASRSVERFSIPYDIKDGVWVVLIKEKTYPEIKDYESFDINPMPIFTIERPDTEAIKLLARQIISFYPPEECLSDFRFPGKLSDMIASGEYDALIATDEKGTIGGGIIWRWRIVRKKTVECFGPYIFNQAPGSDMAAKLTEALIGSIAKSHSICLINAYATKEMPKQYFEYLGQIDYSSTSNGAIIPRNYYYRMLQEDLGCKVWSHPSLESFLLSQYKHLAFPRDVIVTQYGGETKPVHSVFGTHFVKKQQTVILRPVWDGIDASKNLSRHVKTLTKEDMKIILFEIDTGQAWQANLTPVLFENGFLPRLILPYAGSADVVVFEYREGA